MPLLSITSVESTECFVGPAEQPRQVARIRLQRNLSRPGDLQVTGPGLRGSAAVPPGDGEVLVEVPMVVDPRHRPGATVDVEVLASAAAGSAEDRAPTARRTAELVVAEPGWTMFLVSHFHYDPVWWNTQAAYTQVSDLQADDGLTRPVWEHNGFDLVRAHLALAARDEDYRFVLAEVDYLKPFWDTHPEERQAIRDLIAAGRLEIMGGTYNEPNTNLTAAETTIRNFVYGMGYQRSVIGGDPQTAWQLDAFGHDPQFPGLAAEAGLTSSAWARGPHHQWGPILSTFKEVGGDVRNMQFPAEFEWLSPSGKGVLTHYMPNHYSAGWWMDSSVTLEEAEDKVYELYLALKPAASTRNLLLPVGTDYTPPNKWVTAIHRDWNAKYLWPRFVCGNPSEFFAAVRAELAAGGVAPSPQSRDMNPVYTGKDVSFIDTKQAQRAGEVAALDAEKLATFATLLGLGSWPDRALDKVWRQLAYGAHHDAITGSESDQVYIDLLSGWREAHDLAADVRDRSLLALLGAVDTTGAGRPVVVVNTLGFARTDLARVLVAAPGRRVRAGRRRPPGRRRGSGGAAPGRVRGGRTDPPGLPGPRRAVHRLADLAPAARPGADVRRRWVHLDPGRGGRCLRPDHPQRPLPGHRLGSAGRRAEQHRRARLRPRARPTGRGGQRAAVLRRVPRAPGVRRGPVAPAAHRCRHDVGGPGGQLGAGRAQPARAAAGRDGGAAGHPLRAADHAVGRPGPRRPPHPDRPRPAPTGWSG